MSTVRGADASYEARRGELEQYFDRTAAATWERLTSDAPVGRIRATVRAGRDAMRATLLDWLPADLSGLRLLDVGCGTGALAVAAARRGAIVVAVDLSPTLLATAAERLPPELRGRVSFRAGDIVRETGRHDGFDHAVAMDSLIHYELPSILDMLAAILPHVRRSALFTVAPRTPMLAAMHAAGRLFPRGNRAPAIEPVAPAVLARQLDAAPALSGWSRGRARRVAGGFYISEAVELVRRVDRAPPVRPAAMSEAR
ncbi:MAG: magnesium protoporphyrin IX methyltransferase [Gluconacetobacter diazotrophicus]|nr:magnesium protoporphyrin IX methyltransferase [Gluconacetobacter diazotrophicus]